MNWDSFSNATNRSSKKIYEEPYVSSWKLNSNNEVIPKTTIDYKEKCRCVNTSDSNIFNIT